MLDSIVAQDPIAAANPTFQTTVSSSEPIIKDVDFIVQGVFLTQRKEGFFFTDTSQADITGQITFGGKLANVTFTPAKAIGSTEQVTAIMFSGTSHIDIEPTNSALFSFTATMNASEMGGPFDSFSAAIITRWEATASVIPEPSSTFSLLALGSLGAASTLKRKHKQ